jgi:hypothetical protein
MEQLGYLSNVTMGWRARIWFPEEPDKEEIFLFIIMNLLYQRVK